MLFSLFSVEKFCLLATILKLSNYLELRENNKAVVFEKWKLSRLYYQEEVPKVIKALLQNVMCTFCQTPLTYSFEL